MYVYVCGVGGVAWRKSVCMSGFLGGGASPDSCCVFVCVGGGCVFAGRAVRRARCALDSVARVAVAGAPAAAGRRSLPTPRPPCGAAPPLTHPLGCGQDGRQQRRGAQSRVHRGRHVCPPRAARARHAGALLPHAQPPPLLPPPGGGGDWALHASARGRVADRCSLRLRARVSPALGPPSPLHPASPSLLPPTPATTNRLRRRTLRWRSQR